MGLNLSVIIVSWNTRTHLIACVQSFLDGGVQENRIVVVDQNSSDGSIDALKAAFPGVKVIVTDGKAGYGECVNRAFPFVQTELFVVSNADVIVEKDCLRVIAKEFDAGDRIALAGCEVRDPTGAVVTRFTRLSIARALLLELIPRSWRGTWRDLQIALRRGSRGVFDVTYVEGAFMVLRSRLFEAVGGFDAGFTFFFEDADLPIRFKKSGYRVIHVPHAAVTHIGGASFSQVPLKHAAEFNRNFVTLYERHARRRAVWLRKALLGTIIVKISFLYSVRILPWIGTRLNGRIDVLEVKKKSLSKASPTEMRRGDIRHSVSVVIPTANREEALFTLVNGLREQSLPPDEVLIVDQSETISPIKETFYNSLKSPFRVVRTTSVGRPTAKNIGILYATADILLFCDDDFEPPPDLIQVHIQSLQEVGVGGVSCRHTEVNLPYTNSTRILRITWFGQMLDGYQSDVTVRVGTLAGPNMSIRRDVIRHTGYFETLLTGTSIFEEPEYSERIRNSGYDILFTNRTCGFHRPQKDGNRSIRKAIPIRYYRDFHHNELVYFLKNRNHLLLVFVIPFCFLRSVKQSVIHHQGIMGVVQMFSGVFAGIRSYYWSLQ